MHMSAPDPGTAATAKTVDATRTAGALALTRFKRGFVFMTVMCTAIPIGKLPPNGYAPAHASRHHNG